MAKLAPFFGGHTGEMKIYANNLPVGKGQYTQFSDFQAAFDGSYKFFTVSGKLAIQLALSDQNATSQSGPCAITLNGQADNAGKYQVNGAKLTITTKLNATPIDIYPSEGGTQVDHISGQNIWIGQWN